MAQEHKIEARRWRQLAGWVGAGLCCLAVIALLDGLLSRFWEPASLIKLLPGMATEIDGPLGEPVRGVQELTYLSDSNDLTLAFAEVHKGYFLGGDMWRGRITASSRIIPGEYHLTVVPRRSTTSMATPAFRILVFADPVSLRRSSKSLVRRYTGLSPWGVAALCLPGVLLSFGTVFCLSLRLERLWAQEGRAEIYRVIRKDGDFEIHFSLGTEHGVRPGLDLSVYNPQGQAVGLARVAAAAARDAVAMVTANQEIRPGFMVVITELRPD
ncbi:MAG: hypothetical protein ACLQUW_02775 [Desulfobaccales bacterium]